VNPAPAQLNQLLRKREGTVHLLGIGGIGMVGLARLLQQRGFSVSGCDLQRNHLTDRLEQHGIRIFTGHAPEHLTGAIDWVIRSTAVPVDHPELLTARQRGLPVFRRGEVLAELLRDRFTIAVSGTHGKTTVTAIIVQLLDCGYCLGGEIPGWPDTANDGPVMAVEADESDGTAALYTPDLAVITNIEYDHMEHHADEASFFQVFEKFCGGTRKKIFYCGNDPHAARIAGRFPNAENYSQLEIRPNQLPLHGAHNRMNARAALAVCRETGLRDLEFFKRLAHVHPPKRRFEIIAQHKGITVVSDYAHHPTELRCLLHTARELQPRRVLMIFQPHRYTRTRALGPDFPPALTDADRLWITPVYAASEQPLPGGTSQDLIARFPAGKAAYAESPEAAWREVQNELETGDLLLIAGAGDIEQLASQIARKFTQTPDQKGKSESSEKSSASPA